MDYTQIGQRIRQARLLRELSQEALAELADISTTHMSHIETGSTKLSLPVLVKIAAALQKPVDAFLFDTRTSNNEEVLHHINTILADCDEPTCRFLLNLLECAKSALVQSFPK